MTALIHLGYAVGTGEPVAIPVQHLAVTGQTQASGKTTTLEALVSRSGLSAIAFVTKRHEASFRGEHHRIAPYFRERADWQTVQAILEATMREKMRFERSWIMRASKGAQTLADVQRNVQRLMTKAKGLHADVYYTLDHYFDIVVPQIARLPSTTTMTLKPGLNVMDLTGYTMELQSLVIRSVIEWVYETASNIVVLIPEAWEFIPQARGSPCLLACEQLIRKGGAGGNHVWLDSQDIAAIHKNVLRSVGVWILGVQREANEVKRTLQHIPGKKPKIDDVMQLERGQFYVCHGRTVVKTYVQPAWLDNDTARRVATGQEIDDRFVAALAPKAAPERDINEEMMDCYQRGPWPPMEETVKPEEAEALRETNEQLKVRVRVLEGELVDLRRSLAGNEPAWGGRMPPAGTVRPQAPPIDPHAPPPPVVEPDARLPDLSIDSIYRYIRERALADGDPRIIALFKAVPEIEVNKKIERIKIDYGTQPGALAAMIAEGFFNDPVKPLVIIPELKRRGRNVHAANVSRDLGRLCEQGFLTRESGGSYQAVPGMKINIVEAA